MDSKMSLIGTVLLLLTFADLYEMQEFINVTGAPGSTYLFSTEEFANVFLAERFCERLGSELASLESFEEMKAIGDYVNIKKGIRKWEYWYVNAHKRYTHYTWGRGPSAELKKSNLWCYDSPQLHEGCVFFSTSDKLRNCLATLVCDHHTKPALCEKNPNAGGLPGCEC